VGTLRSCVEKKKLEIWDRAQLEAAWCPKFDHKYYFGVVAVARVKI